MTYCSVRDLASLFRKKHEETEKRSSRPEQLIASGSPASTDFQRSHNQQSLLFSDITMTVGDHETTVNSGSNPSIPSASASDSEISDKNDPNQHNTGGYHLRWSRLKKTVMVQEKNSGLLRGSIAAPTATSNAELKLNSGGVGAVEKTILAQVSGCAAPGEVLAMMGPSGSGKTTLLNALSGRTSYDSGILSVNGLPITGNEGALKRLKSKIAYVKQADIMFTHLTVRDQLGYTAFLRLPQAWSRESKLAEVERIIKLLRLSKVADSPISLLSGGEKKRTNIGTELLTDPACLLLDEPTSGLDSTSAVALIHMLQHLARTQRKTVITSIHQPNSALFRSFDKLIMLAEGHVVYFGTPHDSLGYLRDHALACPDGYNLADHWMDLLVSDSAIEEQQELLTDGGESSIVDIGSTEHTLPDGISDDKTKPTTMKKLKSTLRRKKLSSSTTSRQQLIDAWDGEAIAEQMDMQLKDVSNDEATSDQSYSKYNTSWGAQYRVLVHRSLKNSRSAIFTPINLIKSALLGAIVGLLWFQLDYTEKTVFDRSSYYFFTMTYWVFDAMFQALLAFPAEREVILKERASGSYHLSAYFMAKTTSEMPTRLVLPLIYMVISFWMAGISKRVDIFIFSTLISLLSVVAGESIGLLVGASIYDMERAMATMTVVALTLALLGGFFVENVPAFISWGQYVSPFKYSFDGARQLAFDRAVPCDGSGALEDLCSGGAESASAEDVIEFLNIQGGVGFNVGLLIVLGLVPRYIAYLALRVKKEGER